MSKKLLKRAGLAVGDVVKVNFRIADQNAVNVPDELRIALEGNTVAQQVWEGLTPGKRRGLAYRVFSARTSTTRQKRVAEVISTLLQSASG